MQQVIFCCCVLLTTNFPFFTKKKKNLSRDCKLFCFIFLKTTYFCYYRRCWQHIGRWIEVAYAPPHLQNVGCASKCSSQMTSPTIWILMTKDYLLLLTSLPWHRCLLTCLGSEIRMSYRLIVFLICLSSDRQTTFVIHQQTHRRIQE